MIERLIDSLKKAASRAVEFTKAREQDKPELFVDFIDGLKVAAGSAHQLAHSQENPRWLDVRDYLEGTIEVGQHLPVEYGSEVIWDKISEMLLNLSVKTQQMTVARAMPRYEVLLELNKRKNRLN